MEYTKAQTLFTRYRKLVGVHFAAALTFSLPHYAAAEFAIGDHGAVTVGLDAEFEHDSNIQGNSLEDGDNIAILIPKVLYKFNRGDLLLDASLGYQIKEYDEQSQFDTNNARFKFSAAYPQDAEGNYQVMIEGGFLESSNPDTDLQSIIKRESYFFDVDLRYNVTDSYYVTGSVNYRDEQAVDSTFINPITQQLRFVNDVTTLAFPVDLFYRYSDDLAFGFGYRYRDTAVSNTPPADSVDHAIYGRILGNITPTIKANLRFGYQERNFDESVYVDNDGIYAEARVTWAATEQTDFYVAGGQDFRTSAGNTVIEERYAEIGVEHNFNDRLSTELALTGLELEYETVGGVKVRSNDKWQIVLNSSYELIEDRVTVYLHMRHSDTSSDDPGSDYVRAVALLGFNLLY